MKKVCIVLVALFVFVAFASASFAATAKKVATDNPENAKQGFVPDKTKAVPAKDTEPKAKVDKTNTGKKIEKKEEQKKK